LFLIFEAKVDHFFQKLKAAERREISLIPRLSGFGI